MLLLLLSLLLLFSSTDDAAANGGQTGSGTTSKISRDTAGNSVGHEEEAEAEEEAKDLGGSTLSISTPSPLLLWLLLFLLFGILTIDGNEAFIIIIVVVVVVGESEGPVFTHKKGLYINMICCGESVEWLMDFALFLGVFSILYTKRHKIL
jgi:hypothetical protein